MLIVFRQYDVICRELSTKLSKTLIEIESELDGALATTTMHFDVDRYVLVISGYAMLGKLDVITYILP